MHGNRPWDFPQEFTVDSDGDVSPVGGETGKYWNREAQLTADAVEREEIRELTADARERHHRDHPEHVSGCHECATMQGTFVPPEQHLIIVDLNDFPWQVHEAVSTDNYPPVRARLTGLS